MFVIILTSDSLLSGIGGADHNNNKNNNNNLDFTLSDDETTSQITETESEWEKLQKQKKTKKQQQQQQQQHIVNKAEIDKGKKNIKDTENVADSQDILAVINAKDTLSPNSKTKVKSAESAAIKDNAQNLKVKDEDNGDGDESSDFSFSEDIGDDLSKAEGTELF